jgi:hypothetical protein
MLYYFAFDGEIKCIVASHISIAYVKAKRYQNDVSSSTCILMDVM